MKKRFSNKNERYLLIHGIVKHSIYLSTDGKRYYSFKKLKKELEEHNITKNEFQAYLYEFGVHPKNHSFIPTLLEINYNGLSDSFEASKFSSWESS